MWGSCLDHVLEVEVVTADGSIIRANETENPDMFFVSAQFSQKLGSISTDFYRP